MSGAEGVAGGLHSWAVDLLCDSIHTREWRQLHQYLQWIELSDSARSNFNGKNQVESRHVLLSSLFPSSVREESYSQAELSKSILSENTDPTTAAFGRATRGKGFGVEKEKRESDGQINGGSGKGKELEVSAEERLYFLRNVGPFRRYREMIASSVHHLSQSVDAHEQSNRQNKSKATSAHRRDMVTSDLSLQLSGLLVAFPFLTDRLDPLWRGFALPTHLRPGYYAAKLRHDGASPLWFARARSFAARLGHEDPLSGSPLASLIDRQIESLMDSSLSSLCVAMGGGGRDGQTSDEGERGIHPGIAEGVSKSLAILMGGRKDEAEAAAKKKRINVPQWLADSLRAVLHFAYWACRRVDVRLAHYAAVLLAVHRDSICTLFSVVSPSDKEKATTEEKAESRPPRWETRGAAVASIFQEALALEALVDSAWASVFPSTKPTPKTPRSGVLVDADGKKEGVGGSPKRNSAQSTRESDPSLPLLFRLVEEGRGEEGDFGPLTRLASCWGHLKALTLDVGDLMVASLASLMDSQRASLFCAGIPFTLTLRLLDLFLQAVPAGSLALSPGIPESVARGGVACPGIGSEQLLGVGEQTGEGSRRATAPFQLSPLHDPPAGFSEQDFARSAAASQGAAGLAFRPPVASPLKSGGEKSPQRARPVPAEVRRGYLFESGARHAASASESSPHIPLSLCNAMEVMLLCLLEQMPYEEASSIVQVTALRDLLDFQQVQWDYERADNFLKRAVEVIAPFKRKEEG
uniref:Uncharacterized protein n=1 Tax=Chromera velia CCMP2878 TaxID=1169474 RepID=A0A0G4GG90_9ALVE|eukprot:Cvel_4669.t1-p1 / transcript=Cvel_4669.t1 / gene=Cvel_4669 / organism=Chromera_velia_CCMP2878 / gene_product=hypothetical protein / transcript_product=hypothetical protein / location=Cvel_scaffold206:85095-87347(+) / protein_length=751 / sequence_SO=supercontig / SO=protein_coding / is_pseudo=false